MNTRTRQQYSPHGRAEGIAVEVWIGGQWITWFTQLTPEKAASAQRRLNERKATKSATLIKLNG